MEGDIGKTWSSTKRNIIGAMSTATILMFG